MSRFIFLFIVLFIFSCSDPPPRTKLTKAEKELVDSLYAIISGPVRKDADSICDQMFSDLYQYNIDSLEREYLKEIELILNEKAN